MNTVSERINLLIKELGYNKNSFSKAIGMGNNVTIGRLINENRDPSFDVLQRIIQTFGHIINAKWLLTGEGQMKTSEMNTANEPKEVYFSAENKEDFHKIISNLEFLSASIQRELEKLKSKVSP